MLDSNSFEQNLDHRGQAVRCATCCGDDVMGLRVIDPVIYSINDVRRRAVFHRGRYHYLFDACAKIRGQLGFGLESTCAVNDHVHTIKRQIR